MQAKPILTPGEIETLRAIHGRISAERPAERGVQMTAHFALEDGLSGVIALGQGMLNCNGDFKAASDGVRKAVLTSG